ncbi:hypothetical protein [Hymenobacter jeollabukensis]|uniref:Uncharacterized protein n=1 Tax=Hymenobacter jeollabukensis TaxID=2025313 RepID=A0A5R8WNF7_9BACT|nr:hypothetical protein [Hymenobacter jeollabukensis]TLM91245.1 hypothetical protein FDY95_16780 [Hymenobacter jeollabukensis]
MISRTACLAGLGSLALLTALVAARPATPAAPAPRTAPAAKTRTLLSTAATQSFWRRYSCAPLWQLSSSGNSARSGFFGQSGFRIDFALLRVQRDASNPNIYRVEGKSRCLKNIAVPFEGVIVLKQVYQAPAEANTPSRYTVVGTFEFVEQRIARNTGTYRGTVSADVAPDGSSLALTRIEGSSVGLCGYKFEGQWRSTEGEVERVVWADNWRTLASQVFHDFEMGDRMPSINPKYAERGWSRYWDNDEWWAESPAANARLSL